LGKGYIYLRGGNIVVIGILWILGILDEFIVMIGFWGIAMEFFIIIKLITYQLDRCL